MNLIPQPLRILACLLVCCLLPARLAAAERVDHLFEALVPIDSAAPEVQSLALQKGLADVLVKISGYSRTAEFEGLESALAEAPQLVSEFGIRQAQRASASGIGSEETAALYMRFPQEQVQSLLRQFELPQWPALRPQTLVLVVSHLGGRPWLIGRERWPAIYAELDHWSWSRGVPLMLLSQQQIENLGVSPRAASELDQLALQVVAEMSQVERIALIQVSPQPDGPHIQLDVLSGVGLSQQAQAQMVSMGDLLALMDDYADALSLASAFVALASSNNQVQLLIEGVDTFETYLQLKSRLESIDQVDELRLLRVDETGMQFQLQFQSGLSQLQQGLRRLPMLAEVPLRSEEQSGGATILQYRLRDSMTP